jgi:hypothetical protein
LLFPANEQLHVPKNATNVDPKFQFAARFRRNAFGWKSDTPIKRIKEALTEIKAVAKKEPILAAEGCSTVPGKAGAGH